MNPREELAPFDWSFVLAHLGGDEELLKEIAAMFLEECPRLITRLEQAVAGRDPQQLESSAHTLKGAVGNFGARQAFDAALRLEKMGRSGDLQDVDEASAHLTESLQRLMVALQELVAE